MKMQLNQPYTKDEMNIALKHMKSGKTPGISGLPVEFYKMFWPKIGDILYDAITQMEANEEVDDELCIAVINLIPKASRDTRFLKNARPISLLEVDYKIVDKMLANGLLVVK